MIKEQDVLDNLEHYQNEQGKNYYFVMVETIDDIYTIDVRLNIFRGENDRWAIAFEQFGHYLDGNYPKGEFMFTIGYFGNCLFNLEKGYRKEDVNHYYVNLIEPNSYKNASSDHSGASLKEDAEFILVRGQQVKISHDKEDYEKAGIKISSSADIGWLHAGELMVSQHSNLFRATDDELYKSIPRDLKKILVLDEWYHRNFCMTQPRSPEPEEEIIKGWKELNSLREHQLSLDEYKATTTRYEQTAVQENEKNWNENRPSVYETWQLLAKVIATGDTGYYKPALPPNTHWKNWAWW